MDATLDAALQLVTADLARAGGHETPPARLSIIAMGRLGGRELGYGSDADVLFVFEPGTSEASGAETAARFANEVAAALRALLSRAGGDPPVQVDVNLRPEGRDGPLARSLTSYRSYYHRWSSIWERQALLRARPCAGDVELGRRFIALVDPLRYPAEGLDAAEVREIRRLKARIDGERLPRGADPATHIKLGRGGLGDVEWTIQLLQLQHAHRIPSLRQTATLAGLDAARQAGLVSEQQADILSDAWITATRTRNAIRLVTGRADDQLPAPSAGAVLRGIGRALGYPATVESGRIDDDYRRRARRARRVVEQIFYDADSSG